jgi:hypothetical protein
MEADKTKIPILTSEEKMRLIQEKLQNQESQKARKLLASAMTHFEALKLVRDKLEQEALNGQHRNGHRLFKK